MSAMPMNYRNTLPQPDDNMKCYKKNIALPRSDDNMKKYERRKKNTQGSGPSRPCHLLLPNLGLNFLSSNFKLVRRLGCKSLYGKSPEFQGNREKNCTKRKSLKK